MPETLKRKNKQELDSHQVVKPEPPPKKKKLVVDETEEYPLVLPDPVLEATHSFVLQAPKSCRFCLADMTEVGGMKIKDFGFHRLMHWIAQHIGYLVTSPTLSKRGL